MSRGRLALLIGAPLALIMAAELAARMFGPSVVTPAVLTARAEKLQVDFTELARAAHSSAVCALDRGPDEALTCAGARLRPRFEGAGVASLDAGYRSWIGTPAELTGVTPGDRPHCVVRSIGLRTSLLAATPVGADGRFGVASFVLDSPLSEEPFAALLSRDLVRGIDVVARFQRPERPSHEASLTEARAAALEGPSGEVLGELVLHPLPPEAASSARRSTVRAWAVILIALLAAGLPEWRGILARPAGLGVALAAITAIRTLSVVARVPEQILPRSLASPSLFGLAGAWGLGRSPVALLETAVAALLVVALLRRFVRRAPLSWTRWIAPPVTFLALAATVMLQGLSISLARDARIPLLSFIAASRSVGHAVLLLALIAAIGAVAGSIGAAWTAWRRALRRPAREPRRPIDVVALLVATALAGLTLQHTWDRIVLERMRSEFAPQVLQQSALRRLALQDSVRELASSEVARSTLPATTGSVDAYGLWLSSALFRQGYLSSLDVFAADGSSRGHFAFGLPVFDEPPPAAPVAEGQISARDEVSPVGATRLRLIHVEATAYDGHRPVATVVGHVLDQPDNLPFLPSVAPYLAAIGPGTPRTSPSAAPDYVLYDAERNVVLNTVAEPPAAGPALLAAAARGADVTVAAGTERFVGLPVLEGERLHLLLTPQRSRFEALAGLVRLVLLEVLVGAVAWLGVKAVRSGRPAGVLGSLRGSLYRRLLASILVASVVPLVGFALFLRTYAERRIEARLVESSAVLVGAVRRVVEDYAAVLHDDDGPSTPRINDEVLSWLREIVDQEIHLYERGTLSATSKPELFASGLLLPRLPGAVQRAVVEEGLPYLVREERLGRSPLPVAYARVDLPGAGAQAVVAVPLVLQQREIARTVERVLEMLMLATVVLVLLLASASAWVARSVARPVRALADAAERLARGDYSARATAEGRDEVASLVGGFNSMASALAAQRADLELRRDYMEALLRNATTGVVSTDADGRVVTVNPAAARLMAGVGGRLEPGVSLRDAVAAVPPLAPVAAALDRRGPDGRGPEEIDLFLPGGVRRLRLVRVALPDPLGGPPGTLHLVDDVTELMRSNQLAAWAEMARAIAHEIKNPLTPIQLSTEHLERLLSDRGALPSPEVQACLETILKQVRALREIAAEFSAYAKLPVLEARPVEPGEFLREVLAPYRAVLPPGVRLDERYDAAPEVAVDRRVLSRAIVNLVENALHAMPAGGTLTVRSGPHADGGASLCVADTGPGIAPEVRSRLFEPYFSTKSSGTGLGLAIVKRAVEGHAGRIEVDSAPGRGTAFRIILPAASADRTDTSGVDPNS